LSLACKSSAERLKVQVVHPDLFYYIMENIWKFN
jgi:hypothetical protein